MFCSNYARSRPGRLRFCTLYYVMYLKQNTKQFNLPFVFVNISGIPITQQHLVWNNTELDDEYCLQDYDIQDGSTLKLVPTMRVGPINTRRSEHFQFFSVAYIFMHTVDYNIPEPMFSL